MCYKYHDCPLLCSTVHVFFCFLWSAHRNFNHRIQTLRNGDSLPGREEGLFVEKLLCSAQPNTGRFEGEPRIFLGSNLTVVKRSISLRLHSSEAVRRVVTARCMGDACLKREKYNRSCRKSGQFGCGLLGNKQGLCRCIDALEQWLTGGSLSSHGRRLVGRV